MRSRAYVDTLGLALRECLSAGRGELATLDKDLIVVHLWAGAGGVAIAVITGVMALAEQHNLVREELVRVAWQSAADAHSTTNVAVQIVMVVVVVSVEVILHPGPRVRKVIVVGIVVGTTIIVIDSFLAVVLSCRSKHRRVEVSASRQVQ